MGHAFGTFVTMSARGRLVKASLVEVEECGVWVFVVKLVECFVDDVGSVWGADSALRRVEVCLYFRGGVEEYRFRGDSA